MAWVTTGANLKGPPGIQGNPGIQGPAGGTGTTGPAGQSVTIHGSVANAAALPVPSGANSDWGYITTDTGHLWVNTSGTQFIDVGNITGPPGATGGQGAPGATGATGNTGAAGTTGAAGNQGARGTGWFVGHGPPGTITGAMTGDQYLNLDDGTVYTY